MCEWVSRRNAPRIAALSCAALLLGLAGCGGLSDIERGARDDTDRAQAELTKLAEKRRNEWSSLRVAERPWLDIEPVETRKGGALPVALTAKDAVTLPLKDIKNDDSLAARIEAATTVEVRLLGPSSGVGPAIGFAQALADGWTPAAGIWTGPLGRLLDAWCAVGGYEWRYRDGRIDVVRQMTVTFGVNALAGRQEYRARTSSTGSDRGQGSGASAGQSISTRARFEPWPEIEAQLEQLVGGGADLSVSPGNASVTVTGTPARVDRVRGYLRHLNRTVLRPVNLSLHVYAVRIERDADYRIGIASLIDRVLGESVRVEIGSGRIAIVKPDGLPEGARTLNAALTALQSVGTASRVLSADVPSLNGMPAQFYELLKTAYLAEAEVTSTDSGTRTSLKPGQINSGFSLSYTARITAPDELLVRLVVSLRDRPRFTVFGTETIRIQLPEYGDRGVQATQRLRRGETLVVSGFKDRAASANRTGTLHDAVPLPEGERRAERFRQEQVLLLTADIGAPLGVSETSEAEL